MSLEDKIKASAITGHEQMKAEEEALVPSRIRQVPLFPVRPGS